MIRLGGVLAFLIAAGTPVRAALPDEAWLSALSVHFAAAKPAVISPVFFPPPPIPVVAFKGLSLKGVQFSRTDRVPQSLVAAIDKTEKTLILALYDLRLPEVADALLRAKARGVKVRLVYDEGHGKAAEPGAALESDAELGTALASGGPSPEFQRLLDAGVPIRLLKGGGSYGIMHNKFAVFDGELVVTGSFNWTVAADKNNFENVIFRSDPALAEGFAKAWDWMWGFGHDPKTSITDAGTGFGAPPADSRRTVSFAGGKWPRYAFSPQGGIEDMLVDAVGRAKSAIDVAIFSFYAQRVADALIAAKARGVAVRVSADSSQARRSPAIKALADAGVKLRLSAGRDGIGVLHHKFAVVDGKWLMTGAYNFSQNAELNNFENVLFSVEPGEVAAYGGEFGAVWDQARAAASGDLSP